MRLENNPDNASQQLLQWHHRKQLGVKAGGDCPGQLDNGFLGASGNAFSPILFARDAVPAGMIRFRHVP